MNGTSQKAIVLLSICALCMCSCFVVINADDSYAADYGTATNITIAPGMKYTYTPTYPSDLSVTTTIELQKSGSTTGTTVSIATMSSGTLTVTIPSNAASGTTYHIVLKATTSTNGISQTAYQYLKFTVTTNLTVSGSQANIVKGTAVSITPTASGMGTITWAVKSGTSLPAGLSLTTSTGKVTGTPTAIGTNTIQLTATTSYGESKDLAITFKVYSKINSTSAESVITTYGTTKSSTALTNASDIGVTWALTSGTMPSGFSLNASTGVVSGSSSSTVNSTIVITGSSTAGPSQSVTKSITIRVEPVASVSGSSTIGTYNNGTSTVSTTSTYSAPTGTSGVTWSLTGAPTGVTINSSTGVVTVGTTAAVTTGTTFTVKMTNTVTGLTATKTVTLIVEPKISISGNSSIYAIAGSDASATYSSTSGATVTWAINKTNAPTGTTVSWDSTNKTVSISGSSPASTFTVTLTATSTYGQTATKTISMGVVSSLTFTSSATAGAIIYVTE